MGSLVALLGIVARRSLANRRLLATVVVGIVLASALMSAVVLYSDAIRDLGLRHALETQNPLAMDLQVTSSSAPVRKEDSVPLLNQTAQLLKGYAGNIIDHTVTYGRSATFFLTPPGAPVPADDNKPRANFEFSQGITDHIRIVEGRAPQAAAAPADPTTAPSLEVWLGEAAAAQLGVKVGDTFDLHPFWKPLAAPVVVTVAGLVEPNDPNEAYWFGKTDRFVDATTSWPTYLFIVDEAAFTDVLANYLQDMDGTFETYAFIDIGHINSRNAQSVQNALGGLDATLKRNLARTSMQTSLQTTIASYQTKLFFTRLPLFALMAQVVGVVLYYLMMVASMLVERQAGEIALLKSRGASPLQIVGIYAIEGGLLSAAGALAGPFAAAAAIGILGYTPPFHDLTGGRILSVPITVAAFGMAGLGAILALAATLWPAYRAAASTVIDHKRQLARPPQQPLFL
jgi:putative ABC transport system permease protein